MLALNSIAKLGMAATLAVLWMWSAEIYPTSIRNSMMGISDVGNRIGGIAAFWIADIVSTGGTKSPSIPVTVLLRSLYATVCSDLPRN